MSGVWATSRGYLHPLRITPLTGSCRSSTLSRVGTWLSWYSRHRSADPWGGHRPALTESRPRLGTFSSLRTVKSNGCHPTVPWSRTPSGRAPERFTVPGPVYRPVLHDQHCPKWSPFVIGMSSTRSPDRDISQHYRSYPRRNRSGIAFALSLVLDTFLIWILYFTAAPSRLACRRTSPPRLCGEMSAPVPSSQGHYPLTHRCITGGRGTGTEFPPLPERHGGSFRATPSGPARNIWR